MTDFNTVSLNWVFFLGASSDNAARKVLREISDRLSYDLAVSLLERYGKDPALFRAVCTIALGAEEIKAAVYETLVLCNKLGTAWSVTGPSEYEGPSWGLTGYAAKPQSHFHVSGVEMAEFDLVVGVEATH